MTRKLVYKLESINAQVQTLDEILRAAVETGERSSKEREKLLQDHWRQRKELATYQHAAQDLAALKDDNEALRAERSQISARLQTLLAQIKALGAELRA